MKPSTLLLLLALLTAACATNISPTGGTDGGHVAAFRGLVATPPQLAFTCVIPGCDTTFSVKVSSNVNRRIAIKRVVLSDANPDFTVTPAQATPFILSAAGDFDVKVRLLPASAPKAADVNLLVTYTDAAVDDSPDRVEPGELPVPLVRRLVGEPYLQATPATLAFGVVPVQSTKNLTVTVENAGFGNIALAVDGYDAGGLPLTVKLGTIAALVPDAGAAVPITFSPQTELFLKGTVELSSSTPGVAPVYVSVEGTSYTWPRIVVEPEETAIDLGQVPRGGTGKVTVHLANIGGQALNITKVAVADPSNNVSAALGNGMTSGTLDPLQRLDVQLSLDAGTAGDIAASLNIDSSDPLRPHLQIPVTGTVTSPQLQTTPSSADWGTMPQGWVVSKTFEVRNVGYGNLNVKHVGFITGSSTLFTIKNLPTLPAVLERNARLTFDVEFRAESAAAFAASLSIETDDPATQFLEVKLSATGAACSAACPIAHGTAACQAGVCAIGSCNSGYYDSNLSAADGCECAELGTDPGGLCGSGLSKGTLSDSGSSATVNGVLPTADDVDYITFFAQDASSAGELFGDNYHVRINLTTSDPNIQMCVDWQETASFICVMSNESCGSSFDRKGSYGHNDSSSFSIKIYRKAGTAPTCTSYSLYMSNG